MIQTGSVAEERYNVIFGPSDRVRVHYHVDSGRGNLLYRGRRADFEHIAGMTLGPRRARDLARVFRAGGY